MQNLAVGGHAYLLFYEFFERLPGLYLPALTVPGQPLDYQGYDFLLDPIWVPSEYSQGIRKDIGLLLGLIIPRHQEFDPLGLR